MKITKNIEKLAKGEMLKSVFSKKQVIDLIENGYATISINQRKAQVLKPTSSLKTLVNKQIDATTRAQLAKSGLSTKSQNIKVMSGIFFKSKHHNLEKHTLAFSKNPVFKTKTLVIVENFENLRLIEDQEIYNIFPGAAFCWRNGSRSIIKAFDKIIYYGDFDPAALKIFLSEIPHQNKLFFVPDSLEADIKKHGRGDLYTKQHKFLDYIKQSKREDVQTVLQILQKYQKTLEQEFYINV